MCTNETNLSTSSLLKYLRMVYDMESSIYQQVKLIKQLSEIEPPLPPLPPPDQEKPTFKGGKLLMAIGLSSLSIAIVLLFFSSQYWSNAVSALLLLAGIVSIYNSFAGKAANKENVAQWEIDNARRREYTAAIAKRRYINNEVKLAEGKVVESNRFLEQIYSNNIIYPKYRNLPAISSFLDYFSSGRCSSLTGPYGAYNLYENEARLDGIITRLDNINTQLNRIQFHQQMLFFAVRDCNETVDRLYHAVKNSADHLASIAASQSRIEENSAMAAYRAKLLEKESAYRNMMDYGVDYL